MQTKYIIIIAVVIAVIMIGVVIGVGMLNDRPDLKVWHETVLDAEFSRDLGLGSFPSYCSTTDLSPQERVLEYLIFHIADCIDIE